MSSHRDCCLIGYIVLMMTNKREVCKGPGTDGTYGRSVPPIRYAGNTALAY